MAVDGLFCTGVDLHRRLVVEGQCLHHHDHTELAARVDEEVRIEDAGPCAAARAATIGQLLGGELEAISTSNLTPAWAEFDIPPVVLL